MTLTQAIVEYSTDHNKCVYFSVKAICTDIDKRNFVYQVTSHLGFFVDFIIVIYAKDVSYRWLCKKNSRNWSYAIQLQQMWNDTSQLQMGI